MSGLLPRSEKYATKMVPSLARMMLGSSSFVGLPVDSRIGSVGANARGGDWSRHAAAIDSSSAIETARSRSATEAEVGHRDQQEHDRGCDDVQPVPARPRGGALLSGHRRLRQSRDLG